eukprot:4762835-Amphidinium_carterae.1
MTGRVALAALANVCTSALGLHMCQALLELLPPTVELRISTCDVHSDAARVHEELRVSHQSRLKAK